MNEEENDNDNEEEERRQLEERKRKPLQLDFLNNAASNSTASNSSSTVSNVSVVKNSENTEVDELEEFMQDIHQEVEEIMMNRPEDSSAMPLEPEDEDSEYEIQNNDDELFAYDIILIIRRNTYIHHHNRFASKVAKRKDLAAVDHSKETYQPFKKNFYIESPEIAKLSRKQIELIREEMEHIKIRVSDISI